MIKNEYEVVILGHGPAGLQAAIHAGRAKVSVLVMGHPEKSSIYKAHIENYCCLSHISGGDLLKQGREQTLSAGADILEEDAVEISHDGDFVTVTTESGTSIRSRAVIITIGVSRNSLNVPGETRLRGYGVSYCVDCDANFFRGRPVVITGTGSSAVSGALTLASYTDTVHLVAEKIEVGDALYRQLSAGSVIVHEGRKIGSIEGDQNVEGVVLDDGTKIVSDAIFIELGAKGAMELAGYIGVVMDDDMKHIVVNRQQETNVPGIYAAGDICGPPWQIAKAVGEGCVAGLEAAKYAKRFRLKEKAI
ncbi:MAG: NAD(P)/FAD-dependent oxidoreductase [Spirochaetes bacterium]|jgi:thioredoxin reductase (NADPH)|nr:NAD(P)/FAD-dependent oxidoreductase [Spirochaetota bacterium]